MTRENNIKQIAKELVWYVAGIFLLACLHHKPILLTLLVLLFCVVQLTLFRQKNDIYYFVVGGILGPLVDLIAVPFGLWEYAHPSFSGIPLWLPLALGMMVVLIKRIAEEIAIITQK